MPRRGSSSCICQHDPKFLCNPILVFVAQAIIERTDLRPEKDAVLQLCHRDAISEAKKALHVESLRCIRAWEDDRTP